MHEPFGDIGTEIAQIAEILDRSFAAEPEALDAPHVMPRADIDALGYWLSLESVAAIVAVPEELDGDVRKRAHDAFSALHTAMPYSEAERGWLLRISRNRSVPSEEAFPDAIAAEEGQILSAGVKRTVRGRDLMRQWTAWRRGTDEFEGQEGLNQAREALSRLQELMS